MFFVKIFGAVYARKNFNRRIVFRIDSFEVCNPKINLRQARNKVKSKKAKSKSLDNSSLLPFAFLLFTF